jgi:hypothetical protein
MELSKINCVPFFLYLYTSPDSINNRRMYEILIEDSPSLITVKKIAWESDVKLR